MDWTIPLLGHAQIVEWSSIQSNVSLLIIVVMPTSRPPDALRVGKVRSNHYQQQDITLLLHLPSTPPPPPPVFFQTCWLSHTRSAYLALSVIGRAIIRNRTSNYQISTHRPGSSSRLQHFKPAFRGWHREPHMWPALKQEQRLLRQSPRHEHLAIPCPPQIEVRCAAVRTDSITGVSPFSKAARYLSNASANPARGAVM